jgi:hypothetical protein
MSKYIEIHSEADYKAALALARGCYQADIARGYQSWSGATLQGKARKYSGKYKQSRQNWLARCRQAGIDICINTQDHNRLVIVYGI